MNFYDYLCKALLICFQGVWYCRFRAEVAQKATEGRHSGKSVLKTVQMLETIKHDILDVCNHPSIQGCYMYHAKGVIAKGNGPDHNGIKSFILTAEEMEMGLQPDDPQLHELAISRCTAMRKIEEIFIVKPL